MDIVEVEEEEVDEEEEMGFRNAIRLLQDNCNDQIVLMQNQKANVYLFPLIMENDLIDEESGLKIQNAGYVEYQVSDGLPIGTKGCVERSTCDSFFSLKCAIEHFNSIVENGWPQQTKAQ